MLRIHPGLHAALRRSARDLGISLNDYCARKLAAPVGNLNGLAGATASVEWAASLFGERLIGIVAFGSWARGEPAADSDVDILVVLEDRLPLTRELYRAWDEKSVTWSSRTVEPHFVHLPDLEQRVAGIWAEVSVDGIVLFERGLELSTRLVRVRQELLSGHMVRRVVHGQPYWVEVGQL